MNSSEVSISVTFRSEMGNTLRNKPPWCISKMAPSGLMARDNPSHRRVFVVDTGSTWLINHGATPDARSMSASWRRNTYRIDEFKSRVACSCRENSSLDKILQKIICRPLKSADVDLCYWPLSIATVFTSASAGELMAIQTLSVAMHRARTEELLQASRKLLPRTGDVRQFQRIAGIFVKIEVAYKAPKSILPRQCSVAGWAQLPLAQGCFRDFCSAARWQQQVVAGGRFGKLFFDRPEAHTRLCAAFLNKKSDSVYRCIQSIVPHRSG